MGFAYTSALASTQGTAVASMDLLMYKGHAVQWVQTPLPTSEQPVGIRVQP